MEVSIEEETTASTDGIPTQLAQIGKSMIRSSWAMAVFGTQQMVNIATLAAPSSEKVSVAGAFDAVANTMEEQLDGVFRGAFKTGNSMTQNAFDMLDDDESCEAESVESA